MRAAERPVQDRRILRTRRLLHEALTSLVRVKDYDAISVKEILDRANVGRSTFYMHFRDKDELLVSGIHDMLRLVDPVRGPRAGSRAERLVWFSRPIFEHVSEHRRPGDAKMGARGRAILHEHLRRVLADMITDRVRDDSRSRPKPAARIPPDLLAQYVASSFILVLNWWTETRSRLTADEADALFRALILPALSAA